MRHACSPEEVENPTADNRANDAKQNVENHALTVMIDQVARNESRY